jgi:transposase-like protein
MSMHTTTESSDDGRPLAAEGATTRRRRRWCWEQKLEVIARWEASGLSRVAFCRQEGLGYGNFLAWLRQHTAGSGAQPRGADSGGFLEVRLANEATATGARMEVGAPNGWRVRLGDEFAEGALRRVLHLVGQC